MSIKRAHDEEEQEVAGARPHKKRIVESVQRMPPYTEPAPQQPSFAGIQLMRSITAACALAGFYSVKPTALEMFRAEAEEYMLRFAREIRVSMQNGRRTSPTPQDFITALSRTENTRAARVLAPQLALKLPPDVSRPTIPAPDPPAPPSHDLSKLLTQLIVPQQPTWIPRHFPDLPPKHAWMATEVWPEREKDARKMREKATEEGLLAEQALRKLAAAAKAGQLKAESQRRDGVALAGPGRQRAGAVKAPRNEDIFDLVLQDIGALDSGGGNHRNNAVSKGDATQALEIEDALMVNSNASHWRGGKRHGLPI